MEGTRYRDGTLVDQNQLQRTESTKAAQILDSRTDEWELGIVGGLVVTVNSVNTNRVDLSAGHGYANNAELVFIGVDQLNIALADNTLGAINLLYAFYTELGGSPSPHETNGTAPDTENIASFRVRVLTASQFAALPFTDPTYSQDAQDRAFLLSKITATGGALTSGSITQPPPWRGLKQATLGLPNFGDGIKIVIVSDTTPEGPNGQLSFTQSPNALAWAAPGDTFGPTVLIPNDGYYTLTSSGGSTIQVNVQVTGLPVTPQIVTVSILGLYTQEVPRMSGTDLHHRSLVGTGTPTKQNPHGLSLADISPEFVDEIRFHQQLMHSNGIWRGSSANCLKVSINESPSPDNLLINTPTGADTYFVDGRRLVSIVNSGVSFTDVVSNNKSLYEIFVDASGNVKKSERARQPQPAVLAGLENGIVFVSEDFPAGTYQLTWDTTGAPQLSLNDGPPVLILGTGLYNLRFDFGYIQFYVGSYSNLPGVSPNPPGTFVEVITINPAVSKSKNLSLAQVYFSGSSSGFLGYTPNRGVEAAKLVDTRLFGSIETYHFRDDTLRELELPTDEHSYDGVVIGRPDPRYTEGLTVSILGGLTVTVNGFAPAYVKGRRFEVEGGVNITVQGTSSTVIYVNEHGSISECPITLASFLSANNATDGLNQDGSLILRGAALALVLSDAGSVVDVIDLRRNLGGGNVSVEPWTVGSTNFVYGEFFDLRGAIVYASANKMSVIKVLETVIDDQISLVDDLVIDGGVIILDSAVASLSSIFEVLSSATIRNATVVADIGPITGPLLNGNSASNRHLSLESVALVGAGLTGIKIGPASNTQQVTIRDLVCRVGVAGPATANPVVELQVNTAVDVDGITYDPGLSLTSDGIIKLSGAGINYDLGLSVSGIHSKSTAWVVGFGGSGNTLQNLKVSDCVGIKLDTFSTTPTSKVAFANTTCLGALVLTSLQDSSFSNCSMPNGFGLISVQNVTFTSCIASNLGAINGSNITFTDCQHTSQLHQSGTVDTLTIRGGRYPAGFLADPAGNLSIFRITDCSIGPIVLDGSANRSQIWIERNLLNGSISCNLSAVTKVGLFIKGNSQLVNSKIQCTNVSEAWLTNNRFFSVFASYESAPYWFQASPGSKITDISIDDNRFDIVGTAGAAPPATWAYYVINMLSAPAPNRTERVSIRGNQFHWTPTSLQPILCFHSGRSLSLQILNNRMKSESVGTVTWSTYGGGSTPFTAFHMGLFTSDLPFSDPSAEKSATGDLAIVSGNTAEDSGGPISVPWLVASTGVGGQYFVGSNNMPQIGNTRYPTDGSFVGWCGALSNFTLNNNL